MKRLVYIISGVDSSVQFEWTAKKIKDKYSLAFILINSSRPQILTVLDDMGVSVVFIPYHGKRSILSSFLKVWQCLRQLKPDIIHTHLWEASWLGLVSGILSGVKRRIYTRHHGSIHHLYFKRAVLYDRFLNWLATDIVALSSSHHKLLHQREGVPEQKLQLIPHGFDAEHFLNVSKERVEQIYKKYSIPEEKTVVGIISRYTEWKGIQYILPAVKKTSENNDIFLVLANAKGDYEFKIRKLLESFHKESYVEIEFEKDIAALYRTFDFFIHTPIEREAESYGQVYLESLLSGCQCIFTMSGILCDVEKRFNFMKVPYKDSTSIFNSIRHLVKTPLDVNHNRSPGDALTVNQMVSNLEQLYEKK